MNAIEFLTNSSLTAEKYIKKFFDSEKKKAAKVDPTACEALEILEEYIRGGKKARFALTLLGYQIAGGKDIKKVIPAAFAVELVHNSLVIHDDFIDHDELRRGKKTVHTTYAKKHGEHYGASMAIIAGDLGIFLANRVFSEISISFEETAEAISQFNRLLINTGYGEMMDIDFDFKKDVSWEDILRVRIYKTAHYTFVMPLTVGALLAGADKKLLQSLEKYGEPVGLAFQIRDDILGVFGDQKETGKSTDSDIKEGKKTLLYFNALKMATITDGKFLKKRYGSKDLTRVEIQKIKEIIRSSGALESSQLYAQEMVKQGKKSITKITVNKDYAETLATLADYMVARNK